MKKKIIVKLTDTGKRLDKFLVEELAFSRGQIQKLIKEGLVLVNGKIPAPHHFLKENETIELNQITNNKSPITNVRAPLLPKFKLTIVQQTPDYLIVNKPAGIPVHPDSRYLNGTLIQEVVKKYPEIKRIGDDKVRPGLVHRLDKDVSGLMVIPRTKKMFLHLKDQFTKHDIIKIYIALVHGKVTPEKGIIDFPIARASRGLMVARPHNQEGKVALTEYDTIKNFINYTLVKVNIKTGRTHQIRAHFKALNHPVVGDTLHKVKKQKEEKVPLDRLWLHAKELEFSDLEGKRQKFISKVPAELENYLKQIK